MSSLRATLSRMRLGVGVGLVAAIAAAAFALSSSASHEVITLQVSPARIELPFVGGENTSLPARFAWSPADPTGADSRVSQCWNGTWDRSQLTSDRGEGALCSSRAAGAVGGGSGTTTAEYFPNEAGRYEAVVRRSTPCEVDCDPPPLPHWNASNVVVYEVVDPCRLRLGALETRTSHTPMMVDAPVRCDVFVDGTVRLRGEDGSVLALASAGNSWTYHPTELRAPVFRLRSTGARADLDFNLKQHLGGLITRASTPAAQVISVAPADVTMRHRGGVTTVRVRRGTVVALGIGQYDFGSPLRRSEIYRFCPRGRPTIRCLARIRYRFF